MSPRDRSPVKTLSPRRPSGQDHGNQMSPLHNLILQQPAGSSGKKRNAPPTEPGFSHVFFLHSVTDGVLVPCRLHLVI